MFGQPKQSNRDQPQTMRGGLTPPEYQVGIPTVSPATPSIITKKNYQSYLKTAAIGTTSIALMFGVALGTFASLKDNASVAAPLVALQAPDGSQQILEYGANELYTHGSFFSESLKLFIEQELSFIEANLSTMEIVYYKNGNETLRLPILSKGKEGSWWETPAGLYEISLKEESHFSSFGQVYQPYSMVFQGNFFIHGWPKYPDGTPVPEGYSGGCIRLSTEDAKTLYEMVDINTPVVVYEDTFNGDSFVYEESLPDISADEYLIADIANNTVLTASDMDAVHAIASLTKLMTALIAAEYINLDNDVPVVQEKYVTTLIPRLRGSRTASMYSLLQLLLVESSNEAAEVIAAQLGREHFLDLMNKKTSALGLSSTTFTDPSGLDDGNVSTIADLFRLAQYIYNNRNFIFELTANQHLPTAYVSGDFGELENFNRIEDMESFIGGKIGETEAAGQTNLSLHAVEINGEERTLVVVLLGSKNRTSDVEKLLSYVEQRYR